MIATASSRRRAGFTFVLIALVVPLGIAAVLLWSFLGRSTQLSAVPVAIVNQDVAVTVGSGDAAKPIAAGRQLASTLTDPATPGRYRLGWVLTNAEDAEAGLAQGRYHAVLTIPASFSSDLTSSSSDAPRQAHVTVETPSGADDVTGELATQVAAAAADALGDQASASFLDSTLVGFNTISQQFGEAAESADSLASAGATLASSSATLGDGASGLSASMIDLESGAASVVDGASSLASGAVALDDGAAQVETAASDLSAGAADLAQGAAGAATAAEGLSDATSRLAASAGDLAAGCPADAGALYCARVAALAERSRAIAAASDDVSAAQLTVSTGASSVSAGSSALSTATVSVAAGAASTRQGAADLAAGASTLSDGVASAASGAADVAMGAAQLAAATQSAADGSAQLAAALHQGADAVPTYTDDQRTALQTVTTQPIVTDTAHVSGGALAGWPAALIAAIVLWLGAVASSGLRRAGVTSPLVTPAGSDLRGAISAAIPPLLAAALQGLAVWVVLAAVGMPAPAAAPAALLTVGAALAFSVIALATRTLWRAHGLVIAVLLLAGQLLFSAGLLPIQTAPGFVEALNPILPLTAFINALAGVIAGTAGSAAVGESLLVMLCWSLAFLVAAALVARARRRAAAASATIVVPPSRSTWGRKGVRDPLPGDPLFE